MDTTPAGPDRRWWSTVAQLLLAVAAPVISLALTLRAIALVFTLAGATQPSAQDYDAAAHFALAAGLVAVGLPVLGLVLAIRSDRRSSTALFSTMVVIGLVFAVVVVIFFQLLAGRTEGPTPVPSSSSTRVVCQEHSGGDNRCPGG